VLVIASTVPVKSLEEFVTYAKANPGKMNIGFGQGTGPQLVGELFKKVTGTNIANIPYKGARRRLLTLTCWEGKFRSILAPRRTCFRSFVKASSGRWLSPAGRTARLPRSADDDRAWVPRFGFEFHSGDFGACKDASEYYRQTRMGRSRWAAAPPEGFR
jgi:Tripartite tricarboxylate transporter family receptor